MAGGPCQGVGLTGIELLGGAVAGMSLLYVTGLLIKQKTAGQHHALSRSRVVRRTHPRHFLRGEPCAIMAAPEARRKDAVGAERRNARAHFMIIQEAPMKEGDFIPATPRDRETFVVRPYEKVPITVLVEGSNSHLVRGSNVMLSFLTMKAGSVFDLHSHPEEQIMFVLEGFCDEVIENKMFRVGPGDVIRLPPNIRHGAFVREVDCTVIDVFAPARADYAASFRDQHPDLGMRFV